MYLFSNKPLKEVCHPCVGRDRAFDHNAQHCHGLYVWFASLTVNRPYPGLRRDDKNYFVIFVQKDTPLSIASLKL
jgi:hypothetical protein